MPPPTISILLPIYNAYHFLGDALVSLAGQTFKDFEVIAVDDGSTDGSSDLLLEASKKAPWLHIIRQTNRGMANALNHGLSHCHGEFIARMDADDIARPERFEKQLSTLIANPRAGIVGATIRTMGDGARKKWRYPLTSDNVRARTFFSSPFAHPVVMFRREAITFRHPLYREDIIVAQDYELWSNLVWRTECINLPDVLLDYRRHREQLSSSKNATMERETNAVWASLIEKLGLEASSSQIFAHGILAGRTQAMSVDDLKVVAKWAERLEQANAEQLFIPTNAWRQELKRGWYLACRNASIHCRGILTIYQKSKFRYKLNNGTDTARLIQLVLSRIRPTPR